MPYFLTKIIVSIHLLWYRSLRSVTRLVVESTSHYGVRITGASMFYVYHMRSPTSFAEDQNGHRHSKASTYPNPAQSQCDAQSSSPTRTARIIGTLDFDVCENIQQFVPLCMSFIMIQMRDIFAFSATRLRCIGRSCSFDTFEEFSHVLIICDKRLPRWPSRQKAWSV